MNNKSVAILGGGACGQAISAYLANKGYDVRLCEINEFRQNVEPLLNDPVIRLEGEAGEGEIPLSLVTTDFEQAVNDCKWINVVLPAYGHKAFASALAPHLTDGQIVVVNPGPSLGSLAFRHHLQEEGARANVTFAETHWVTLNGKLKEPGYVNVSMIVPTSWFAALPSSDTSVIKDGFMEMFPNAKPKPTILHTSLESFNIMAHSGPMVLNAGRVEYAEGDYRHYAEGITPAVGRVIDAYDQERMKLCKSLGIDTEPHRFIVADIFPTPGQGRPKNCYEAYQTPHLEESYGPDSLESRYLTEDIPYGLVSWVSMGEALGISMPVSKSLITLASSLMDTDYWEDGRTLSNIGLPDIENPDDLLSVVK